MYQEWPSLYAGMTPRLIRLRIACGVVPRSSASLATDQMVSSESMIICLRSAIVRFFDFLSPVVFMLCMFSGFTFILRDGDKHCHLHLIAEMVMHEDFPILSERIVVIVDGAAHGVRPASWEGSVLDVSLCDGTNPFGDTCDFSIVIVFGF